MQFQGLLVENTKIVLGDVKLLDGGALATDRVSMKGYERCAVILALDPASGTDVTAITMKQSKTVDNSPSSEKALSFTKVYKNGDTSVSDTLVETAVVANTFNTSNSAKKELFVIEILQTDLDIDNDFDCIALNATDPGSVSTPGAVIFVLYNARYKGATPPTAITD